MRTLKSTPSKLRMYHFLSRKRWLKKPWRLTICRRAKCPNKSTPERLRWGGPKQNLDTAIRKRETSADSKKWHKHHRLDRTLIPSTRALALVISLCHQCPLRRWSLRKIWRNNRWWLPKYCRIRLLGNLNKPRFWNMIMKIRRVARIHWTPARVETKLGNRR